MIELNKQYLIKTTTIYYVGRIVAVTPMEVKVDQCSEVYETGNMAEALRTGIYKTKEYVGDGVILPRMQTAFIPHEKELPSGRIL